MRKIDRPFDAEKNEEMILPITMGTYGMYSQQPTERLGHLANLIMLRAVAHVAGERPYTRREELENIVLDEFGAYDEEGTVDVAPSSVDLIPYLNDGEREGLVREASIQRAFLATVGPPPLQEEFEMREHFEDDEDEDDSYEDDQPVNESVPDLQELLKILGSGEEMDCSLCDVPDCSIRKAPYDAAKARLDATRRHDN